MKKLKGLNNRLYNVIFHTHTVAGIVISFALFVIFYAGAFSLFRYELKQWENPAMRKPPIENPNLDQAFMIADSIYDIDRHQIATIYPPNKINPLIRIYGALNNSQDRNYMATYVDPETGNVQDILNPVTTLSETIYHLHYFDQIPVVGLYLAGFIALFFLFATVTGILIHWRNLLTKFYAFINEGKWKVIWTNAHTVLGVLGLPFQIIYAITGAFYGLLTLILLPTVFLIYGGDVNKVYEIGQPHRGIEVREDAKDVDHMSLSVLSKTIEANYPNHHIVRIQVMNYGKEDAVGAWSIDNDKGITSPGIITYQLSNGKLLEEYSVFPHNKSYESSVLDFMFKLHFASFGGLFMKIIYFILSMITCFMIISGVMIWRKARDTNQYSYQQRLFHHRVTKIYLAICLSLFPAFATIFLANKMVPLDLANRSFYVNVLFFSSWLLMTIIGSFWNKYSLQNRNFLLFGGLLSLMIPVVNGLQTRHWIWEVWSDFPWVAYIDVFWLATGCIALYTGLGVLKVKPTSDKPIKEKEQTTIKGPVNPKATKIKWAN